MVARNLYEQENKPFFKQKYEFTTPNKALQLTAAVALATELLR